MSLVREAHSFAGVDGNAAAAEIIGAALNFPLEIGAVLSFPLLMRIENRLGLRCCRLELKIRRIRGVV
jgi:hypothetical protein